MDATTVGVLQRRLGIAPACARVLQALLAADGAVLDALALMSAAQCSKAQDASVITVHISRLRATLRREGLGRAVETIYGRGYAIGREAAAAIAGLQEPAAPAQG
jgi:DNA-binding winged helix-turn-helix (wHTH) protein